MRVLKSVLGILSALSVLSATAAPLRVSACMPSPAAACCCGDECPCPKPPQGLPGDGCAARKEAPSAELPAPAAPAAGPACLLPAAPLRLERPLPEARTALPRMEPGWDPGGSGFFLPLLL